MKISSTLRREIEADIERCKGQIGYDGSEKLYNELVAKYSVVDSDFSKSLPKSGKVTTLGSEFDYRSEIQAIAAKLSMWLTLCRAEEDKSMDTLLDRINSFIQRGEAIKVSDEYHPAVDFFPSYIAGPKFDSWMADIHIFNQRYLKLHPLHGDIEKIYSTYKKIADSSCDDMLALLRSLAGDKEFFDNISLPPAKTGTTSGQTSNRVFVVHGHDDAARLEVTRTLEKIGFEAIILHEQPNSGRTIIEKIETYTDVAYGIVLYTGCDVGRAKEVPVESERERARQNVVFEHGYLIGKLGRAHVCALVKGDIETPGDIDGVVYTPLDSSGAWKFRLAQEMRAAGLDIDANKLL